MRLFSKEDERIGTLHKAVSIAFSHVRQDTTHIFSWLSFFHKKHQEHEQRLSQIEHQLILLNRQLEYNPNTEKLAMHEGKLAQLDSQLQQLKPAQTHETQTAIQFHNDRLTRVENQLNVKSPLHDEKLLLHDKRLARIEEQLSSLPSSRQEIRQIIDDSYSYDDILKKIDEIRVRMELLEHQKLDKKPGIRERIVRKIAKNSKDYVKSVIFSMIKKYGEISAPQLKEIIIDEQGLCSKSSFYRLLAEMEQENGLESIQKGKEKTFFYRPEIVK